MLEILIVRMYCKRKPEMISFKSCLVIACAVLTVGGFYGGLGVIPSSASAAPIVQASADGAPRIKPEEVRELLKKNKAVLVDVRGSNAYKAGHIKGALNIPYSEIADRVGELPRDKMIVTYCS